VLLSRADDSRGSKAFIGVCVCVCVSVCPRDKTKTAENIITKLATGIVHHESSPINYYVKRSKVKIIGSQSAKHIEGDRVTCVSYALYRVPSTEFFSIFDLK